MTKGLIFGLLCVSSISSQTSSENIWTAATRGEITVSEANRYLLMTLQGQGKQLPEHLQSTTKDKCGFPIVSYLRSQRMNAFRKRQQSMIDTVFTHTFATPRGNRTFRFHYTDTGIDAIPLTDANINGIPDWLEEAGQAAERSYRLEVDTLGYREPLNFDIYGRYDMYFVDTDAYGTTYFDSLITSNPDTYVTSIEIENDFAGFFTTGYDALRVTIAHEFHHAIQLAYVDRSTDDTWYYELTSTWMEEVVYDEVNDYLQYLSASFDSPQRSLSTCLGIRCGYHIAHFDHLIEKKHGRNVIRASWDNFVTRDALSALDDALRSRGSTLKAEFADFVSWNFFTGSRSTALYYPEGSSYPLVRFDFRRSQLDTTVTRSLEPLAANYFAFAITDTVNAQIVLNSEFRDRFNLIAIEYNPPTSKFFVNNFGTAVSSFVTDLLPGDSLILIVANRDFSAMTEYSVDVFFTSGKRISDVRLFPAPFLLRDANASLFVRFKLGAFSDIRFEIFSSSGTLVHRRDVANVAPGPHDGRFESEFRWNGRDTRGKQVPSGIYYYRLKGIGFEKAGKIAVVR